MPKQIEYEQDARKKLKTGVDQLAKAVIITLGPRGKNVVFEKMGGSPQMSCDGRVGDFKESAGRTIETDFN